MDQAKLGAEALEAKNYAEAIKQYTAALAVSPTSPDYLIKRSTAYQRSTPADYRSALADADKAVINAQKRGKRELILQGQLRRAIALFGLERYPDCRFVLDIVKRMDPKEKTLPIWESKVATKMAAVEGSKDVTVKETPEEETPVASQPKPDSSSKTTAPTSSAPPALTQTPADKIRHDWYQNNDKVYFTLLAKGVPKDKATIDIQPRSLAIAFPLQTSSDYNFSLEPLFAEIDPSASTFSIMSTKVEVVLKKAQPGQKWSSLEGNEPVTGESSTTSSVPAAVLQNSTTTAQKGPSYPTSSRSGPKNWDKLASEALAKPKTGDSRADGKVEEEEDDEGGDPVNGFFKKLYAGADPDTRRAMMKSFSESNGTALSTNWDEVRKGKVETSPPDGLEAKKW
ncbi:SGS-domain-containing protein [Aureobasidium subglaciale]|nr:SGS-domain-containing protein [Aureobasidium subglaciale]